jgi:hypothetical protein
MSFGLTSLLHVLDEQRVHGLPRQVRSSVH